MRRPLSAGGRPRKTTQEGNRKDICFAGAIIVDMLPFCLYFVASVITGFHVYTLLALAVYGAPSNPLELVSLLGSLCLSIAAYVSLYKPHAAARLALLACLAIWCFYGPAIGKPIRTRFEQTEFCVSRSVALYPSPILETAGRDDVPGCARKGAYPGAEFRGD